MSENPTIKPGTYDIDLGGRDDVQSVSVCTIVVPKPPSRFSLEIVVVPKPKPRGPEQSS
ncbi:MULTISPECIES: hypothetical protein [unclassified Rhodanobacter]|uniref:hypothetical protein n=1 Tax=unclassified Rhodanobacter TaxID=2621553 RepID=UPI001BE0EFC6|nr:MULTISPECIES: hypothetical protein [unclassified Rhodanobacter]MBT2145444.1 hypothetical protein [Rhodanobacter sp. LX-99]MBT2149489.1 hypothetical protein [Rhodanobacter sp. LX-100]